MVLAALLLIALWMLAGSLTASLVAASRGYDETYWAVLGLLLGPIAAAALLFMPRLEAPSFLVHGRVNTELMECPTCRHVGPRRTRCGSCGDDVRLGDDGADDVAPSAEPSAATVDRGRPR